MVHENEKEIFGGPSISFKEEKKMKFDKNDKSEPGFIKKYSAPIVVSKQPDQRAHFTQKDIIKTTEGITLGANDKEIGQTQICNAIKKPQNNIPEKKDEVAKKSDTGKSDKVDKLSPETSLQSADGKKSASNKAFKIIEPGKNPITIEPEILDRRQKPENKKEEEKVSPPKSNETDKNQSLQKGSPEERKEIDEAIINSAKILNIEVVESPTIKVGTIITMNAGGLIDSKRLLKDGCAYFGTASTQDQYSMNDFIMPADEKGSGLRHFMIRYHVDKKAYFLKDLEEGTGTFVRITPKLILRNNTIISFGNIHFAIIFPTPAPQIPSKNISVTDINTTIPEIAKTKEIAKTEPQLDSKKEIQISPTNDNKNLPQNSIMIKFLEGPKAKQVLYF